MTRTQIAFYTNYFEIYLENCPLTIQQVAVEREFAALQQSGRVELLDPAQHRTTSPFGTPSGKSARTISKELLLLRAGSSSKKHYYDPDIGRLDDRDLAADGESDGIQLRRPRPLSAVARSSTTNTVDGTGAVSRPGGGQFGGGIPASFGGSLPDATWLCIMLVRGNGTTRGVRGNRVHGRSREGGYDEICCGRCSCSQRVIAESFL